MRAVLEQWIREAEAARHLQHLQIEQASIDLERVRGRADDLYISLVGELFECMRDAEAESGEWGRLGNAFLHYVGGRDGWFQEALGIPSGEAALYSASAFYSGGYPASAYLAIQEADRTHGGEVSEACHDFLTRRAGPESELGTRVLTALRRGDLQTLDRLVEDVTDVARRALLDGPEPWIQARLLQQLLTRFRRTNIRAVLPDGTSDRWTPLVSSFLNRSTPIWDFFPSQIEAIEGGLLDERTVSLQMPTGAGKTALSETLIFSHLTSHPGEAAVLLVPYRSLASELRGTLVRRLREMGIPALCFYGGGVPDTAEVQDLNDVRAVVATPEALSGALSAAPEFLQRVSLVICDEGHLLDSKDRGVSLELLLSRLREHGGEGIRFVYLSAIVPNIDEVNAWLGGTDETVVRSEYRPALAEFAVLRSEGTGVSTAVDLVMHPHVTEQEYTIPNILDRDDFIWINPETGRPNTWKYSTFKTQAVAVSRRVLPMGTTAVFSANKHGNQGAVGLAEELIEQEQRGLPLPRPADFAEADALRDAIAYFRSEYGEDWIGTQALGTGAVVHHGDIPQETREVIEEMLREGQIRLAFCTNTLAEGVNLPIRTLVLYSVERRGRGGFSTRLRTRDIKNLVGRAGRAGASTKGLVICANQNQWESIEPVARQLEVERVRGGLRRLLEELRSKLAIEGGVVTNERLESNPVYYGLVDGIDSILIDLVAEEVGEAELVDLARGLADETFASAQGDQLSRDLLREVFAHRARRVSAIHRSGRVSWIRESGARPRLLEEVEEGLRPMWDGWDVVETPLDSELVQTLVDWAWEDREFLASIQGAFRAEEKDSLDEERAAFEQILQMWLAGRTFREIGAETGLEMNRVLGIYSYSMSYLFQTLVEQATAILSKLLKEEGMVLAPAVRAFPDHLRFGVSDPIGCILRVGGVRHRQAAVQLALVLRELEFVPEDPGPLLGVARRLLNENPERWEDRLGSLVFRNTLQDVAR